MSRTATLPRPLAPLGVLVLALAWLAWSTPPLAAHAVLVETSPQADETVEAAPDDVVLTFSEDIAEPSSVEVFDADGNDVADGDHEIDGEHVTQPVAITADGEYEVVWRVVSADDHPVDGEFAFDVVDAEPDEPDAAEDPEPLEEPEGPDEPEEVETEVEEAVADDEGGVGALPIVLGAVVLAALLGGAAFWARRRGEGVEPEA